MYKEVYNYFKDNSKIKDTNNDAENKCNKKKLNQFITCKDKNKNGTFVRILTIVRKAFFNQVFLNNKKLEKNKMYQKCSKNVPKNKFKFLNIDCTTLRSETIELVEFFKNGTKNLETYENGGNFKNDVPILKKLSRYETFINFLIEHNKDEKLPSEKFISKYWIYDNEVICSTSIIKRHKIEALEKGDLIKNDDGRYALSRTEKY